MPDFKKYCFNELAMLKLCSLLKIGPYCMPELPFDGILCKDAFIFHMEICRLIKNGSIQGLEYTI